ncbi:MAG: 3-hydroxyacyl-CoA dehydrogenase NAD-binding domain-containing protein [Flavobacteriales bacterium]|nr:3-hydroxyacyl-CoA dehydrogenase NAD-binding domain-containing protein [Flavobacteriales bacterium]
MFSTTYQDSVATVVFDVPGAPVNAWNTATVQAFAKVLDDVLACPDLKGIILTSGKKDFIVGADLKSLSSEADIAGVMAMVPLFSGLLRRLETCGKTVVAAMNGTALGGGYELALACHYRLCVDNPNIQIGLPEVMIGLLPGGGGTQRLPRLIGIQEALRLMMEGTRLTPDKALKAGLVDALLPDRESLLAEARRLILEKPKTTQPWDEQTFKIPGGAVTHPSNVMMFAGAAGLLLKKTYGNYPAPLNILRAVHEGLQLPLELGLKVEERYFENCLRSPQARHMVRTLFLHMNAAGKREAAAGDSRDVKKLGILGAGMMGAGIAYVSALAGMEVVLKDVSAEAAEKGKDYSRRLLSERVAKGRMGQADADAILDRIHATGDYAPLAGCDLVIEAVFEDRALKNTVTRETEALLDAGAVFGSNTSTLPITGLAQASQRPQNFIGIHFFSPVEKMQLVEIIMGRETSEYARNMALDYVRKIKKTPIVVNDSRGFYTSRIFTTYLFEGFHMVAEGVNPALIENGARLAGMMVGPLAVADEVSIELAYKVMKQTEAETGQPLRTPAAEVVRRFVEEFQRSGRKAGKGFYDYPEFGKKRLWPGLADFYPRAARQPDVEEVQQRFLCIQTLETLRCLEEGIVTHPQDADIGSILGWGFAPYTGGTVSYVEFAGIQRFADTCRRLEEKHGERFRIPKILEEKLKAGKRGFYD